MRQTLAETKPSWILATPHGRTLQRKCACGSAVQEAGSCTICAHRRSLQRKLALGDSQDAFEVEADQVAEQVVAGAVHRGIQGAPPRIQRLSAGSEASHAEVPASVALALGSSGDALPVPLRAEMERRIGYDLAHVRIHTNDVAQQSARDVDAHAYTVGRDIVFASDQFAPHTQRGQRLLAHELVHTIQQSAGQGPARLQRQSTARAPEPENRAMREGVPYEKWSEQVEGLYRRVGDPRAAAVARCRTQGGQACATLLTLREVDALHRAAQEASGDEQQAAARVREIMPAAGMMTPLVGPGQSPVGPPPPWITGGAGAAEAAAARTAAARALTTVAAEGVVAAEVGVGTAAAEGAVGTAVPTGAVVAGVAAIVAVVVVAGIQLWQLGRFQAALRQLGYTILEDPLAQAICHGCHSAPRSPAPLEPTLRLPPSTRFPDLEPEALRRFLEPQPDADPTPHPGPQERPDEERRRQRRPRAYPICWPFSLPPPMLPVFARVRGADRDEDDARQARMQADWRAFRDPSFDPRAFHVHHVQPLFLSGLDNLRVNGILWPARMHLRGHAALRNQPQMLRPRPPLLPLPADIYSHPAGTPYELAGFKVSSSDECV
jgi:Domain of unknown function (DUF4157)